MCFWIDADQLFIADAVCSIPFVANKAKNDFNDWRWKIKWLLTPQLRLIWIWLVMRFEIHEIRKRLNYGSKLRSSRTKKWLSSEMDYEFMISSICTLERKLLFYQAEILNFIGFIFNAQLTIKMISYLLLTHFLPNL